MRLARSKLNRRRLLWLAAGAAGRLAASEQSFWNSKPPSAWDAGDIYQLTNHSPWANPVHSWAPIFNLGQRRQGGRASSLELPPLPEAGPKGVVTWESAQPLRDALKTPLPPDFADCYVIGVDGIPLGDILDLDFVRGFTSLQSKGRTRWNVRPLLARELIRNSVVYAFGFPRSAAPIDPAEIGDVYFESQFGRWLVQTRFRPREMVYRGQLAL